MLMALHLARVIRYFEIESEVLNKGQLKDIYPALHVDDVVGHYTDSVHIPTCSMSCAHS